MAWNWIALNSTAMAKERIDLTGRGKAMRRRAVAR